MRTMNYEVDARRADPATVARAFLDGQPSRQTP
jgi:glycine betaine/choline ABC-type transport system substrate-binding protein